jgi:GxxExxY protein
VKFFVFLYVLSWPLICRLGFAVTFDHRKAMDSETRTICDVVRNVAYAIHVFHGHGHLEKVYENALFHRLRRAGLHVVQQAPIVVRDEDGTVIGEYFADLLVEGGVIIELKTAKALAHEHFAQILGYLKSTGLNHGLLINFGSYRFEIKKFIRTEPVSPEA